MVFPRHTTSLVNTHFICFYLNFILFYFILFYFILYWLSLLFRLYNIDCQPQIPAEEATIESRNVRPGLCLKTCMRSRLTINASFILFLCIHTYFSIKLHTTWPTLFCVICWALVFIFRLRFPLVFVYVRGGPALLTKIMPWRVEIFNVNTLRMAGPPITHARLIQPC